MHNAARLLKEYSRERRELGVTEVARRLGVSTSTAFRLLTTLAEERLLERGESPGTYRLGLAMYELGLLVFPHYGLHDAAIPVLAALRHSTGETVHLAVLDGLDVVFIERLQSPQTVRYVVNVGHRVPAPTSGNGKVMLAHLPPEELEARLAGWKPVAITPYTITSKQALLADLQRVRERGWAQNINESTMGVASVAVPIRDKSGEVIAALSVVAPAARSTAQALRRTRTAALEAAEAISRRLGYVG